MPQFEPPFVTQIVWLAITFGVLYYFLVKRGLPRVSEILETRRERITADLERAGELRREAEAALAAYEKAVADAQRRAQARLSEVQARLAEETARKQAELEARLAERQAEAEKGIRAARDAAFGEVERVAAEVARAATERLIGVRPSEDDVRAAMRDSGAVREAA